MATDQFPTDIKHSMRDCILSVLWAKKDIYAFFKDNGCTASDMEAIKSYKDENLPRAAMVDRLFERLSGRPDNGLGQFRAMLKALAEWSHFDPYYFDTLAKLDKEAAQRKLDHLRQLIEIRDARIKSHRAEREAAARQAQSTSETRSALLSQFLELYKGTVKPQDRGYKLERLLQGIAKLEGLEPTEPFRCTGEQIDGGLKFEGENYLIEAKWHDRSASTEPLYTFASKIEGKMYGRGVFISINGFMPDPVEGLLKGKAIKTVLVDGEDIILILENHISFGRLLDIKVRSAQLRGEIYVHPLTEKIKHK